MKDNNNLTITLSTNIRDIKGFGPKKTEHLSRLGLCKLEDVLDFFPRAYEDLRHTTNICDIKNEEKVLVRAYVLLANPGKGWGKKRTMRILAEDKTGRIEILFFASGFLKFEIGALYRFFGKCKNENGRITMLHPSYARDDGEEGGIEPVYPLTSGVSQKDIRRLSCEAFEHLDEISDYLPEAIVSSANICSRAYALKNIHYPEDDNKYKEARYRLVFEELFGLKTIMLLSSGAIKTSNKALEMRGDFAKSFINALPYSLTKAQNNALSDILSDLSKNVPMNRLVQGDVGSGKTIVAEAAMVQAVKNGAQAAFMAPTELLARQHYNNLCSDLNSIGIKCCLLIGSMTAKEKKDALSKIKSGEADLIIGTHALISDSVEYKRLALIITDEQHRFGVAQRRMLKEKGVNPHVLVMTATPIPRTLAAVLYADLDISVIDELPPGRVPVKTYKYTENNRKNAYQLAVNEIEQGRQAYIVAPFIEDSEAIDGRSAEDIYEQFVKEYPGIECALLHGQMCAKDKDDIMEKFYEGSIKVLISTVVIEVGINVPNASVMLIENQERFGLAQLHQLRGRVGRGKYQSYCLLISGEDSNISSKRAEIMCSSSDGFVIAEKDLEMRGPGEFFGYRQHGLPQLKFADPVKHLKIAELAGKLSKELITDDPQLDKPENSLYKEHLFNLYNGIDSIIL